MRRKSVTCLPNEMAAAYVALCIVDGALVAFAFLQLLRIHSRNQQLGWTRQKILHVMIGSSNLGYLTYFISTIVATCEGWHCWSNVCGFVLLACPHILSLSAFLLLLSFWIDICHQSNDDDEDEDDEIGFNETLLEKSSRDKGLLQVDGHRKCCFPRTIHVGSRQKFVLLVVFLTFVSMIVFSILIWIGKGENPIDSFLVARVSLDIFSLAMLLLGGALASYGLLLFSKMRKVRSEMVSNEMWKVASLAAVTVTCFTLSAVLALVTNIPLQVPSYWHSVDSVYITNAVAIFLYYFIGSSVPSGFVLWVMREMPSRAAADSGRTGSFTIVSFVREATTSENPQWGSASTSWQNKGPKASPI